MRKLAIIGIVTISLLSLTLGFLLVTRILALSDNDVIAYDGSAPISQPRIIKEIEAVPRQLPDIAKALSESSSEVAYVALAFGSYRKPQSDDAINIQLSIENGKVGFDWILLGQLNIQDRTEFLEFARARGAEPMHRQLNGVRYYRVENIDPVELGLAVMTEMYRLPPDQIISLYHEGFAWPR